MCKAITSLLLCSAALATSLSAQDRRGSSRSISATEYFAAIPFPNSCPLVPLRPSEDERRVISRLSNTAFTASAACAAYTQWLAQGRPSAPDPPSQIDTSDPNFQRESEHTQRWLAANIHRRELLHAFLSDVTIRSLRSIGPQTNWSLLLGMRKLRDGATLADFKGKDNINITRFQKVAQTPFYAKLSDRLKDLVSAELLSSEYVFMAPEVERLRADAEAHVPSASAYLERNVLLSKLVKGDSAVEGIFKVTSPSSSVFHQLNDAVKTDLLALLFNSWDARERAYRHTVYGLQPISIGERGLYAMVAEDNGSALTFLRDLNVREFSQETLRIIMYSLLEGGSMGDASELRVRTQYFQDLLRSPLFVTASSDIKSQLLYAARVPGFGVSATSRQRFDFRKQISRTLEAASLSEHRSAYVQSLARFYERLRITWFLTPGNIATTYTHFSSHPKLDTSAYNQAELNASGFLESSAATLAQVPIEEPWDNVGDLLTIDDRSLPFKPYRARLGGPATRKWFHQQGLRFQTEDVHVKFEDHHDITIRIPTTQIISADSYPPKLTSLITGLALIPGPLRREPSEIVVLPLKKVEARGDKRRTFALYQRSLRSINVFPTASDDPVEGPQSPLVVLFHEYGHVLYFKNRSEVHRSQFIDDYNSAKFSDRAAVSAYANESLDEDFAEAFALRHLLTLLPCHDLNSGFALLFPNRNAFIEKALADVR